MFGRQARLPIDLVFGVVPGQLQVGSSRTYVQKLKERLHYAYQLASSNSRTRAEANKRRHDTKVRECTLEIGDRVLVRNVGLKGKHKLADHWASDVYVIIKKHEDIPVYTVKPESVAAGIRERTLHRNMLLPCGFLPAEEPKPIPAPRRNRQGTRRQLAVQQEEMGSEHSPSEYDSEVEVVMLDSSGLQRSRLEEMDGDPLHPDSDVTGIDLDRLVEADSLAGQENQSEVDRTLPGRDLPGEDPVVREHTVVEEVQEDALHSGTEVDTDSTDNVIEELTRPKRRKLPPKRLTYNTLGRYFRLSKQCTTILE